MHMSNIICKTFLISHDFSFTIRTGRDINSSYEGGGVALSLDGFIFFKAFSRQSPLGDLCNII